MHMVYIAPRVYQEEYIAEWVSKLYTVYVHACQRNHSYAESMFCLHSDHTRGCVIAGVLQHLARTTPPRNYNVILVQYLSDMCPVSTTCCDATITLRKYNQE